MIRFSN